MISVKVKTTGDYKKTRRYLYETNRLAKLDDIQKVADKTVKKLSEVSPYESISKGWSYEIVRKENRGIELYFLNSLIQNGVNIALVIDTGYVSKNGRWVSGKNYISEPVQEAYEKILDETWGEIKKL